MGKKLAENPFIILVGFVASIIAICSFTFSVLSALFVKPENIVQTSSAPVIDSIDLPTTIVCDGRRYDIPIRFHDKDGDVHRIYWQLIYSKKGTTLYTDAKEFYIDSTTQKRGAVYNDFIEWHTSGDVVKIRVFIEDRTELSAFMDFQFQCSN